MWNIGSPITPSYQEPSKGSGSSDEVATPASLVAYERKSFKGRRCSRRKRHSR